jgi:hypothetical protein
MVIVLFSFRLAFSWQDFTGTQAQALLCHGVAWLWPDSVRLCYVSCFKCMIFVFFKI